VPEDDSIVALIKLRKIMVRAVMSAVAWSGLFGEP
jgi:hypothetical protein